MKNVKWSLILWLLSFERGLLVLGQPSSLAVAERHFSVNALRQWNATVCKCWVENCNCRRLGKVVWVKITPAIYGRAWINSNFQTTSTIDSSLDNFDTFDRPVSFGISDTRSWWLQGLYWDLLDSGRNTEGFRRNTSNQVLNPITDFADISLGGSQTNLAPIFNRLTSSINNETQLRNAFIQANQAQANAINQLFDSYGY